MKPAFLLGVVLCLTASGCDDSKNPLSDAKTARPDERLVGVWRGGDEYYHVGHAGEKFPNNVLRIVVVNRRAGKFDPPEEYLTFPTAIGGKTYLNVIRDGDEKLVKGLDEKGWKAVDVDSYTLLRYQVDGDKLTVWIIDEDAKQKAIQSGKVKGTVKSTLAEFTDTGDNLARFVAGAGDSLWNTKEPGRLERLTEGKKP